MTKYKHLTIFETWINKKEKNICHNCLKPINCYDFKYYFADIEGHNNTICFDCVNNSDILTKYCQIADIYYQITDIYYT